MRSDHLAFVRGVTVGVLATTILWLITGCALYQLSQPPRPSVAPRECVGRYVHPDSAGHCVPRDTTVGGHG